MTKADLLWIKKVVNTYAELLEEYPELANNEDTDDLRVVQQLVKEKLSEYSNPRY